MSPFQKVVQNYGTKDINDRPNNFVMIPIIIIITSITVIVIITKIFIVIIIHSLQFTCSLLRIPIFGCSSLF